MQFCELRESPTSYIRRSVLVLFSMTSYRFARMAEKVYRLQNAPFVFTRQRVDVTDVLSALSYDGLPDVGAVCHFVSCRCRAADLKWLSRQSSKRRGCRSFHRSRVSYHTYLHKMISHRVARTLSISFTNMFLTSVVLWRDFKRHSLIPPAWPEVKSLFKKGLFLKRDDNHAQTSSSIGKFYKFFDVWCCAKDERAMFKNYEWQGRYAQQPLLCL